MRARAAEALGRLAAADERVLRALLEALKDENDWVQMFAAWALGQLGVADERVLPALLEALKDEDEFVGAMGGVGPGSIGGGRRARPSGPSWRP